jgi:hypothetical protein
MYLQAHRIKGVPAHKAKVMIHRAYKKGTVARYYYKALQPKLKLTNQQALVRFNQDLNIDWNLIESVIKQICSEQIKML